MSNLFRSGIFKSIVAATFLWAMPGVSLYAQDLHFSQWFNSPLTTNPANTGFIPDADYRIGANYRNQYVNILSVPYKTFSIYGDAQLMRDKFESGWLGVGGVILRDAAGAGNLTSTKIYGSLAYHQEIGVASLLTAGFNVGWANKNINIANLKFPDQFNQSTGFFDADSSSVAFASNNANYMDVQIGMNYAYFPSDKTYINAGISIQHVNRPRETFFSAEPGFDPRLAPRYIGFLNGSFKVSDQVIINPMAYYSNQAKASELVAGGNIAYNLSGDGTTQLVGGIYLRPGDAAIPMLGFQWEQFKMNFTYDVTTSALSAYNGGRGAVEFSLVKTGFFAQFSGKEGSRSVPPFSTFNRNISMRKLICVLLLAGLVNIVYAQDEREPEVKGFDKSKLFFGGNFGASFGDFTLANISPQVGYRFNEHFAAGAGLNFIYSSVKYRDFNGNSQYKVSNGVTGLNIFGRVYPIKYALLQVQPEMNYTWGKYKYYDGVTAPEKVPGTFVPSLLLGGGVVIPSGPGGLVIMIQYDVLNRPRGPYGTRPIYNFGYNVGF